MTFCWTAPFMLLPRAVRLTFPSLLWPTVHTCRDLYPVDCPSSFDGSSLGHASLRRSYHGSAVPRYPPDWLQRRKHFRGGSLLVMLRPACWLERLTSPCRQLAPPTGPPVYGRACPSRSLPQPESAITTRPNHPLPRQDLHLRARQRLKAAHRNWFLVLPLVLDAARVRENWSSGLTKNGAILTEGCRDVNR
jgi:hypothetical protein